jgi:predicted nucleic acid-binding Zn ribbon protein
MPTYVYKFIDTGETIEVQQSFEDAPLTEAPHPSDGAMRPVKKVFTPVGITFKGGGFYKTDSKSGSSASGSSASGSSSTSGTAAASGASSTSGSGDSSSSGSGSSGSSSSGSGSSGQATTSSTSSASPSR